MAPKHQRIAISKAETHRTSPNYMVAGYQALMSPNNTNIVRSVAMFGVRIFFSLKLLHTLFTSFLHSYFLALSLSLSSLVHGATFCFHRKL
ncbi:hypothetical protein Golomagni_03910 [Golovinomyces magnicellulatus]|nr:hypothetical protein Golomagni_03910 [Golovinomyces magnicellulatus]